MNKKFNELYTEGERGFGYPRPQLVRESYISLDGEWEISNSNFQKANNTQERSKIIVPYPPESLLSECKIKLDKTYWYHKTVYITKAFIKNHVLLHFDAIDQISEVYINGIQACKHEGGYLPFIINITDYLFNQNSKSNSEENIEFNIDVKVTDNTSNIYPYGKQKIKRGGMWYTPVSGIWKSVWIESVPETYIKNIEISSNLNSVKIKINPEGNNNLNGRIIIKKENEDIERQFSKNEVCIEIDNPENWTPDNPKLYYFTLYYGEDKIESYFALRTISIKKIKDRQWICLNDIPYYFNGVLDQGYYSDGLYTPRSENEYINDILSMKRMGFNTLRKHIKVEPDCFYTLCDKLGMIVFQDMVNNSGYSFLRDTAIPTVCDVKLNDKLLHNNKKKRKIFIEHSQKIIEHLYNFPCVCYYTIFNEGWGQFCSDEIYEKFKKLDPTRVFDSTSGWFKQNKSDVFSRHVYFKPIKQIESDRPVIVSEFGGYSYRIEKHSFNNKGNYGYGNCTTEEEFTNSITALFENEIIPYIEKGLNGSIYTQLSDVEDETNGFLTYDRAVTKVNENTMNAISKDVSQMWNLKIIN